MKRSKAELLLAKYLSKNGGRMYFINKEPPQKLLELARCCLDGIEKLGMLPPKYNQSVQFLEKPILREIYAWEKE